MLLFVGLGNPGTLYQNTRHNSGFSVLEAFETENGVEIDKEGFKGKYLKLLYHSEEIILLKPQTFMNLSGESVSAVVNFYKIPIDNIVVIYDDMDLPCGKIRLREGGSSGGHNGIKNIINLLGTENIKRIKIGIGHPPYGVIDYVLGKPTKEEEALLVAARKKALNAIDAIIDHDFHYAMSKFN